MLAWWPSAPRIADIRLQISKSREKRLAAGIDDLKFQFVATEATAHGVANPETRWQQTEMPRLIQLSFTRAERLYSFYLETRGLAAWAVNHP
jgi:hypothetical protein